MTSKKRIPADQLEPHNIFVDESTETRLRRDLRLVLDVIETSCGTTVYALGDPETGDYEELFEPAPNQTVHLHSHHGL